MDHPVTPHLHSGGLRARAALLGAVRRYFDSRGFVEVQTPVRVPSAAMESTLRPMACEGAFLRTSPEFALKRVVAAGLPRVYELGPCFRADESGAWHRTEFTLLEWYRVGASLDTLMRDVEGLTRAAARALGVSPPGPWHRVTVSALFAKHTGVSLGTATAQQLYPRHSERWNDAFFRRWLEDIEPQLTVPTFVTQWPASLAALATVRTDRPWPVAERFEAYLGGVELANAFHELIDSTEQQRRFEQCNQQRIARGDPPHPIDTALVRAVGKLPPTVGIALGIDRLLAVLMGWNGIALDQLS